MSNDLDMLEQVLKRSLRAGDLATTPQCLDAETLAAWEDGALDAAAMQIAEIHVSTCARCQSVLAVMAKGTTPATVPVVESNSFLSWHWWFAPIAAATAAVTLWMVVPEQQQQLATAPSSAVAPARDADLQEKAKGDTAPQQSAKNAIPAAEVRDVLKERVQAPTALPAAREDRRERQAASAANKEEAGKLVVQEPALAAADAAAPAATATAPPAPAPALSGAGALQKSARPAAAPLEIVSSDPQRRWRVVATGIEYSTDRGASWIPVRAIGTEVITGGMAPSGSICWLIGRAGAVLITVDGMIFAKVDLPVRVDVASIAATDARSAVVVTADGRTFRTDDSGRNWRQN